jgi:hypothetical protein
LVGQTQGDQNFSRKKFRGHFQRAVRDVVWWDQSHDGEHSHTD